MFKNDESILWVHFIRVIATFFVIMVHTCSSTINGYNDLPIADWWIGNVYASTVRPCVPLFFLLTGYLLLNKDESIKKFFIKRTSKVIFPLFVWSLLYILWHVFYSNKLLELDSLVVFFLAPAHFHLWFLYAIIGLYLYMPILRVFVKNASQDLMYYFVILWFIAVAVIPFFEKLVLTPSKIDLKMISGFVGYLVLGYLIGKYKVNRKYFILAVFVAITMIIITVMGTYLLTIRGGGELNKYFFGYLTPNVIFMSVSFFVILKYLSDRHILINNNKINFIIQKMSSASFGIYLIHIMVLDVLYNGALGFSLKPEFFSVIFSIPLTAISIYFLSFFMVLLLKRIPWVCKIVP